MKNLVNYLEGIRINNECIRIWLKGFDECEECQFEYIKEVLVDSNGNLVGILTRDYEDCGYYQLYKWEDISAFAYSKKDQEEE